MLFLQVLCGVMLSFQFLAIGAAGMVLRSAFNSGVQRTLGEADAIILVDFWERRFCPADNTRFDHLVLRVDKFIRQARDNGVRIFHALSGVEKNWNFSDPQLSSRIWLKEDRDMPYSAVRASRNYLMRKARHNPPAPLDLVNRRPGYTYCQNTSGYETPSSRLHPGIHFEAKKDIIFDAKSFFRQMKTIGVKRLFYAGSALNLCVLHSRKFSAIPAARSKLFQEVGIIQDLTVAGIRRFQPQPGCENLSDEECVAKFFLWMRTALKDLSLHVWETT